MKRILRITVVAFFVSCGIAHARPVLLTSFRQDALAGGGSGPITDLRAQFVLQLPTSPPLGPPVDPFVGLGQGVWWQEGDQGYVDLSAGNDPLFDEFAILAADGVNDWAGIYTPWGGFIHLESELFDRSSDFYGYELAFVRLHVNNLRFELFPELNGSEVFYDITYEFFGSVIPEPATLLLLAPVGMIKLMGRYMR